MAMFRLMSALRSDFLRKFLVLCTIRSAFPFVDRRKRAERICLINNPSNLTIRVKLVIVFYLVVWELVEFL